MSKIFKFDWGDSKDWVFAAEKNEAEAFYINHSGCGDLDMCKVTEVPKEEWPHSYILDINEPEPDSDEEEYDEDDYACGYKIQMSFEEYAEKHTKTDLICTTEL